ncbi:MAG: acyl-CoA dehydrogenase family protein [Gemmatimonadota bacterium]|nr:acyl-CoA dehydrogenase family protein [Candidatus Palauibacterales bacterium]
MRRDYTLTDEQEQVRQLARDFAENELRPHTVRWDATGEFHEEVVPLLGELGFMGMLLPPEYDGLGIDMLTYLLALEQISWGDASVAITMSVHNSLPTQMILRFGNDEQKQKWLPPMARGELLGAFALSEAGSGSDAASLSARAERDGEHWVLNGEKLWVSNGSRADVVMVMVRTDRPDDRRGARGIGAFIVPTDTPGYSVGKKEDKTGLRSSETVAISFNDMRLGPDALLADPYKGFLYAMSGLQGGRLGVAAQALGIAEAALDHTVAYARERRQFGRPISSFQAVSFKFAEMYTRVEASRGLLYRAARAWDAGDVDKRLCSMAKLHASETAVWVTSQAVNLFGGYGFMRDYPVEKLFRDAKVTEIYEGTSEIQRVVIAKELFQEQPSG